MRRLGKLVIMTDKEHASLVCRCEDADAAAGDLAEELSRAYTKVALAEAARDNAIAVARRFHAAGGYSHRLPAVKGQLAHATESLAHCIHLLVAWRPLVASLETTPGQFVDPQFDTKVSVTRELCGIVGPAWYGLLREKVFADMSDLDAPADFLLVGEQVKRERAWKKPDMTREEFESMFQGRWAAAEKVKPQQKKYPPCNQCVEEAGVDVRTCELRAIINGKAVCRA